jgi:putative peptidoglycan lipid II flippase
MANPSTNNYRLLQSTGIVMGAILLSRVLGFFREWMVAHQIGSSAITDAYYAAFTLPDLLNNLVASGALGLVFIPVIAKYMAEDREHEAWHVFCTVMTVMTLALVVLIVLGEIFAPQLVSLMVPGFDPARKAQVVFLTRCMLPAQLFLYLGSLMGAFQNARGKFLIPALAAIIYNLGIIGCGWFFSSRFGVTAFAIGLLAGTFCGFFLLQLHAISRMGRKIAPNLDLSHPGFRLFVKLAIPLVLALSIDFTDSWIIRWFGSFLAPSSITWLTFARTLMLVPLSTVAYALGTASFPLLAQLHSEGKTEELNHILNATLRGLVVFLVPISALGIVLREPIIYFVFSHTRLHATDFQATAAALALFCIGMCGRGLQSLLSRGFNAMRDTITPAIIGTACTFAMFPLYGYCARRWDYLGLAAASSFGVTAYAGVLFTVLCVRTRNRNVGELGSCLARVVVASLLVAPLCSWLTVWLAEFFPMRTARGALAILLLVSAVGLPAILILARILGVAEIETYWRKLTRWIPRRSLLAEDYAVTPEA